MVPSCHQTHPSIKCSFNVSSSPPVPVPSFNSNCISAFVGGIGSSVDNPGVSCKDIYRKRGDLGQGIFYITVRHTVFPVLCDSSIFPGQGNPPFGLILSPSSYICLLVATMLFKMSSGVTGDVFNLLSHPYLNPEDSQSLTTSKSKAHYITYLNEFWERFTRVSLLPSPLLLIFSLSPSSFQNVYLLVYSGVRAVI